MLLIGTGLLHTARLVDGAVEHGMRETHQYRIARSPGSITRQDNRTGLEDGSRESLAMIWPRPKPLEGNISL